MAARIRLTMERGTMSSNSLPDFATLMADAPRVLVVEDELLIRMVVADHLREAGFFVVEAFNGDEAIALLGAGALFDLVFTDVRMPGVADGLDVLDFVRRTRPGLPVLITSGHLESHVAHAAGAVQFLPKPWKLDAIVDAFHAALKGFG